MGKEGCNKSCLLNGSQEMQHDVASEWRAVSRGHTADKLDKFVYCDLEISLAGRRKEHNQEPGHAGKVSRTDAALPAVLTLFVCLWTYKSMKRRGLVLCETRTEEIWFWDFQDQFGLLESKVREWEQASLKRGKTVDKHLRSLQMNLLSQQNTRTFKCRTFSPFIHTSSCSVVPPPQPQLSTML